MPLKFVLLIFSLFSFSAFADGWAGLSLSLPAASFGMPRFEFRDGGRKWTAQELEADSIGSSFETWRRCYENPKAEGCSSVVCDLNVNVIEMENLGRDKCLPARSDLPIAYAKNLQPEQLEARDHLICECYREGRAGVLADLTYTSAGSIENRSKSESERERLRHEGERRQNDALDRLSRQRLVTERFQSSFSAASYETDPETAVGLGAVYNASVGSSNGNSTGGGGSGLMNVSAAENATISNVEKEVANRELTARDFTSSDILTIPGICVPYRQFLASKQFPDDPDFYSQLNSPEFKWKEWNYSELVEEFKSAVGNAPDIATAISRDHSGNVRKIYSRIKFLYDNPVLKNIFQSGKDKSNRATMQKLHEILRTIPRPVCDSSEVCIRDEKWNAGVAGYRQKMAEFLKTEPAIKAGEAGSANDRGSRLQVLVASARSVLLTSDVLNPDTKPVNASDWRTFCDEHELQEQSKKVDTVGFILNLENYLGKRNFEQPLEDKEYKELNDSVCVANHSGPKGTSDFKTYLQTTCGSSTTGDCSIESRAILAGRFLKEYPNSTDAFDGVRAAQILPFLNGAAQIATVNSGNVQRVVETYNRITRDPEYSRSASTFTSGILDSATPARRVVSAQVAPTSSSQAAAAPRSITEPQMFVPLTSAAPVDPAALTQPQAKSDTSRPESPRSQSQSEEDARGIRNEISSLRDVLRREPVEAGAGESQAMLNVSRRLALLENRLAEKEAEIERLKSPRPSQDDSEALPERVVTQTASQNSYRSPASSATQAIIPQGGSAGGSSPQLFQNSGGSFTGISSGNSARVPASSSRYSALLSKYGVREVSEQGGITVATASENIDYDKLRSETESNVIPSLPVTPEDFRLLSQNNQETLSRYLDGITIATGEMVRVNFSSGEKLMEMFVMKTGGQFSVVIPTVQKYKLEDLQNEFAN